MTPKYCKRGFENIGQESSRIFDKRKVGREDGRMDKGQGRGAEFYIFSELTQRSLSFS
jgi:hypothetical protein